MATGAEPYADLNIALPQVMMRLSRNEIKRCASASLLSYVFELIFLTHLFILFF